MATTYEIFETVTYNCLDRQIIQIHMSIKFEVSVTTSSRAIYVNVVENIWWPNVNFLLH